MNNSIEYIGFKAELSKLCQDGVKVGFTSEDIIRALKDQLWLEEEIFGRSGIKEHAT
jgi:hypothetical protein